MHHAVRTAYEGLIFDNHHPSYFLYFNVPNDSIDVNIHPNKTEIKFDNDQSIYAILKSSIKHGLGQFNISPTLDFENSVSLNTPYSYKDKKAFIPPIELNKSFNPFDVFLDSPKASEVNLESSLEKESSFEKIFDQKNSSVSFSAFQLNNTYLITKISSGIVIIDQKRAHQIILYEKFLTELSHDNNSSQTLIFPIKLDLNKEEIRLLIDIKSSLIHLGFSFNKFDKNEIEVSAIHPIFSEKKIHEVFQELIENETSDFKNNSDSLNDYIAKVLSKCSSINSGDKLEKIQQDSLINDLFACKDPNVSPFNKLIFKVISVETVKNIFL